MSLTSIGRFPLLLLVLLCALPLLSAVLMASPRRGRFVTLAVASIAATLVLSLVSLTLTAALPPVSNGLLRLDRLSATMCVLVTGVSTIVHAFSIRYMDSDPGYARFFAWLSFVTGVVLVVVVSNSLALLAMGWIGVSFGLYQLQTHYRGRSATMTAARAMRNAHVVGDVALALGCLALGVTTNESRIDFALANARELTPASVTIIVALFAIAAFSKSSQIPFNRWLPDTMEAPTPVSALMHAGIVNSGGFLLARFSPLVIHAPIVTLIIFLIGAGTALWGAGCMLVRSDVKRGLAFSTQSQMGYMIMQCGLGAFSAAILHLAAHGIFKATLFLGSGYAVHDQKRELRAPAAAKGGRQHRWIGVIAAILVAPVGVLTALSSLGRSLPPYGWILLSFATLTCMQLAFAIVKRGTPAEIGAAALLVLTILPAYAFAVRAFEQFLAGDVSAAALLVAPQVVTATIGIFAGGLVLGWGCLTVPRAVRDRVYVWLLTERLPLGVAR